MAIVSTGAPHDDARGWTKKIIERARGVLLVPTSTMRETVCSAYEATRLARTPMASINVPVNTPYSVMAMPHSP